MILTTRILGYVITLERPSDCPNCSEKLGSDILNRVVDIEDGVLRYILVYKCSICHKIIFVFYEIGKENELPQIEKESKKNPIKAAKIYNSEF